MSTIEPIWLSKLHQCFNQAGKSVRVILDDIRVTAGCPVFQNKPQQPLSLGIRTDKDLQSVCEKNEDRFNNFIKTGLDSLGLVEGKDYDLTPARVKKTSRVREKVQGLEQGGDINTITDGLAMSIWVKNPAAQDKISTFFRPSDNSFTLYYEDSLHRQNIKTGLPRLQVLVNIAGSGGFIGEVLVMPFDQKRLYEITHPLHKKIRELKAAYPVLEQMPQRQLTALTEASEKRKVLMEAYVHKHIDTQEYRTYYEIDGILVAYCCKKGNKNPSAIAYNIATGYMERADGFLQEIDNFGKKLSYSTEIRRLSGRDEFIRLAAEKTIHHVTSSSAVQTEAIPPVQALSIVYN